MKPRNILLTGLPRSGSTLMCHLLNKLPDAVALHEPMRVREFQKYRDNETICDKIDLFFLNTRDALEGSGAAITKKVGDNIPDNHISDEVGTDGLRLSLVEHGEVRFDVPALSDYTLAIKHIAAFTALLGSLVKRHDTYASIRNPLPVLLSWNSVDMAVRNGHAPAAERLDTALTERLEAIHDRISRQVELLAWFFEQFNKYIPADRIIKYENVMATGGACLDVIIPSAGSLREDLKSRNKNSVYDRDLVPLLARELISRGGDFLKFYTNADIEALANKMS